MWFPSLMAGMVQGRRCGCGWTCSHSIMTGTNDGLVFVCFVDGLLFLDI